jgi:hypothetical protein
MIVKITKQLGNFKRGINLYIPKKRINQTAPTTLPLSTPNLYFSGLTLNQEFFDGSTYILISRFVNPYTRYSNALWRGGRNSYGGDNLNFSGGPNGEWRVYANCYIDDGYDFFEASINVATVYNQNGSAIPLTGWEYNTDIVLGGNLIIKTTQ